MKITHAEIRPCLQPLQDPSWKFARATVPYLEGHVLALTDDQGNTGLGYAHAIPAISTHGAGARASLEWLTPGLIGRDLCEIGAIVDEVDACLAHNITAKAAIDMALHDLLARRLGVPLHVLFGGARRESIPQARILAIKTPLEMGRKAEQLVGEGYRQLKLKLSGDTALDVERVASVRAAAGAAVMLTLDPNQSYDAKQMMSAFARMERHDIALIEQPVPAADWKGLKLLTDSLPVAIEADESAQTVHDVLRLVSDRVVDVVNLKITKFGGIRRFMEAARICEAGSVVCRVGAAFGPALLQAAAAHVASTLVRLPYGCELSESQHLANDPFAPLQYNEGAIVVPRSPGCGVAYRATA